ncbi:MAG: TonB-dependent receptor [Gammaproteobacteria bacterium]|nr:TonB-dependent receptor [Gammaproteobacteria bacterium]
MKKIFVFVLGLTMSLWGQMAFCDTPIVTIYGEEIVVTATRSKQLLKDSSVLTTVITKEEIEEIKPQSVKELLKNVSGVNVASYGTLGAQNSISIRSSSSSQVLILIDGRPINRPSTGEVDLSLIPVENIERIEIVKGPVSSLYGANALGGVINIITKTSLEEVNAQASLSAGSFNTKSYSVVGGARVKNLGFLITGGYNSSDGARRNSDCLTRNFSFKTDLESERYSLGFLCDYLEQEKGVPGSTSWLTPKAKQKDEIKGLDFNCKVALTERLNLSGKAYHNYSWNLYKGTPNDEEKPMENNTLGGEVQLDFDLSKRFFILGGLNLAEDSAKTQNINGKHTAQKSAVYIQGEIDLSDRLKATIGLRYDDHSVYKDKLNPRIAVLSKYGEKTDFRLSYGTAFRAPTMNDLYWHEDWGWGMGMFGNPDLTSENSKSYEFGVEHRFSDNLLGRVNFFRNNIEDLIEWAADDPSNPFSPWRPQNIATAYFEGLEQEMKIVFDDHWSLGLGYTHLEARGKKRGETEYEVLQYRPEDKGEAKLEYKNENGLGVGLSLEYTGSRYTSNKPINSVYDLEAYTLLGLRVSQKMEKGDVFLKIDNISDIQYQMRKDYPMPGQSITAGVKFAF